MSVKWRQAMKYGWVVGCVWLGGMGNGFGEVGSGLGGLGVAYVEGVYPEVGRLMELAVGGGVVLEREGLYVREREADLEVVRRQWRPRVDMYARVLGTYETREDLDEDLTRGTVTGNVTATKPLYRWGELKRRERIAALQLEGQGLSYAERAQGVFREIRRTYLQWLLMREQGAILEESIALTERFVSAQRQLQEIGRVAERDVLEMEARLSENRERQVYIARRLQDIAAQLARLTGVEGVIDGLEGGSLAQIEPMDIEAFEAMRAALLGEATLRVGLPEIERWDLMIESEAEQLGILERAHYPKLDLVAGLYTDRLDGVNQQDSVIRLQFYAGVQVTWNIFDGWQTAAREVGVLARKRRYALERDETELEARRRLEAALLEVELNLKQIESRGRRVTLLGRRVALLREQVERNTVAGTELIEAEIEYQEVLQRLRESQVNYMNNIMEVARYVEADPAMELVEAER